MIEIGKTYKNIGQDARRRVLGIVEDWVIVSSMSLDGVPYCISKKDFMSRYVQVPDRVKIWILCWKNETGVHTHSYNQEPSMDDWDGGPFTLTTVEVEI